MNEYYDTTEATEARVAEFVADGWITYPCTDGLGYTICKRTANSISPVYVWGPSAPTANAETDATLAAIDAHLAREAFASILADYLDDLATADDVATAGARMDAMELAKERAGFVSAPSHFATNSR